MASKARMSTRAGAAAAGLLVCGGSMAYASWQNRWRPMRAEAGAVISAAPHTPFNPSMRALGVREFKAEQERRSALQPASPTAVMQVPLAAAQALVTGFLGLVSKVGVHGLGSYSGVNEASLRRAVLERAPGTSLMTVMKSHSAILF